MCADLTIYTEQGMVYEVTHDHGLHVTAHHESSPDELTYDEHVNGFSFPCVGEPLHFSDGTQSPPVTGFT